MTTTFETVQEFIEIAATPALVFERWIRFEEPQFMEGLAEVRQIEERKIRWRGTFAGEMREGTPTSRCGYSVEGLRGARPRLARTVHGPCASNARELAARG